MEMGQGSSAVSLSMVYNGSNMGVADHHPGFKPGNTMMGNMGGNLPITMGPCTPPYPGIYQQQPDMQFGEQTLIQYNRQQPNTIQPIESLSISLINQVLMMQQLPTDVPGLMACPMCRNTVLTRIEYKNGLIVWVSFALLLVVWPLCWIPFCVKSCNDVKHSCPNCNNLLHYYKRR